MAHTFETKISSPNTIIKIITDVSDSEKNVSNHFNDSKELEKSGLEHKESSSTQTSSSSSLLHKRKSHCYYASSAIYRPPNHYNLALLNRQKRNVNPTTQKIISAKFLKVKQLQSELIEAQKKISDLQDENRTLKNIQKRQDSALRKYESQDSYLPQLLKSHEEEMRVLTMKYKKLRSAYNELEVRHNKQCTELMNVKDRHRHLLQISQDKHLLQREQLTKQMDEMKNTINDLKNKIKLQSRRLDLESKNFKHQLSVEFNRNKTLHDQLKQSQDIVQKLQITLKDKDKFMANSKISQSILNKMNQLRLKTPSNNLKPVSRICSTLEQNKNKESSSDEKRSKENFSQDEALRDSIFENSYYDSEEELPSKISFKNIKLIEQKDRKPYSFENGFPSINQNNHCTNDAKNSGEITNSYSSYFDIEYLQKSNSIKDRGISDKDTSDTNNNVKRNFSKESIFKESEENESNEKNSNGYRDEYQNYKQPEQSDDVDGNEKNCDYRNLDDTISWLEFHEKNKKPNEITKLKSVHPHDENRDFREKIIFREDSLPYDKKTALLSALKEIDLENGDKVLSKMPVKFNQSGSLSDQNVKNGELLSSLKSLKTNF